MSNVGDAAAQLEALMPRLMRVLLPSSERDPLGHVPLGQLRLMRALVDGPRVASEAAAELGLSASALSQMAARLEETGLIHREDLPGDKRHRTLALTAEGRTRMEARQRLRAECAASALTTLSAAERSTLISLLDRLVGQETRVAPSSAVEVSGSAPF